MKRTKTLSILLALSVSSVAAAQSGSMNGMDMKDTEKQKCMDMKGMKGGDMKGMDMQDMDMQKCMGMMQGMDNMQQSKDTKGTVHKTAAVVKSVDPVNGKVTLAHDPVNTSTIFKWYCRCVARNWPCTRAALAVAS
jgi:Cu(I)/Ag(I) efflux system protein CusF